MTGLPIDTVQNISIHAPRGGSDGSSAHRLSLEIGFQSTLPVGGATFRILPEGFRFAVRDFNPRSPWGERHKCVNNAGCWIAISIHAPRGGSD